MNKWLADISPNPAPECWLDLDNGKTIERVIYMGSGNIMAAKTAKLVQTLNSSDYSKMTAIIAAMEVK